MQTHQFRNIQTYSLELVKVDISIHIKCRNENQTTRKQPETEHFICMLVSPFIQFCPSDLWTLTGQCTDLQAAWKQTRAWSRNPSDLEAWLLFLLPWRTTERERSTGNQKQQHERKPNLMIRSGTQNSVLGSWLGAEKENKITFHIVQNAYCDSKGTQILWYCQQEKTNNTNVSNAPS